MDVKAFDDEESKLKEQIKNQKKIVQDSKPDKGRVKDMEKNCEGLQQIFTDASEKGRDIKDKVKELTKKIKEITSTRVKAVQSKLEKVQGEVEKVKKEITRYFHFYTYFVFLRRQLLKQNVRFPYPKYSGPKVAHQHSNVAPIIKQVLQLNLGQL